MRRARSFRRGGVEPLFQQLFSTREEILPGDFACVYVSQDRALSLVLFVLDPRLALQHAPRLAALHAEQHQLARKRAVLDIVLRPLHLYVNAEVGNVGPVIRNQIAAVDHILLGNSDEYIFQRNQLGRVIFLDFLQMISEARLRCAPMRHRETVWLVGSLEFRLVPILLNRWIAFEIEGFLIGFAESGGEDKLRRSAPIADALRLSESHVIRYAMFGLAGGKTLQEGRSTILDPIQ